MLFYGFFKILVQPNSASAKISFSGSCIADSVHFKSILGSGNSASWNFGDNNYSSSFNPAHHYASTGKYMVSLLATDSIGCKDTAFLTLKIDSSCLNTVYGIISTSSGTPLKNSPAYVVRFDSIDTTLSIIGKTTTDSTGKYNFIVRDSLVYLVAYPDSNTYPREMITWRDTALVFQDASPVKLKTPSSVNVNFHTLKGVNNSGTGLIGGKVTICLLCKNNNGKPAVGIHLTLIDKKGQSAGSCFTDSLGNFKFPKLATGKYSIWVDKPGVDNKKAPTLSIAAGNMVQDSIKLVLYPDYLDMVITSGVESIVFDKEQLNIYPNPFQGSTNFNYTLSKKSMVSLEVFDLPGRKVATLISGEQVQGSHDILFNPSEYGVSEAGMFIIKMSIGDKLATYKVIMTR